MNLTTPFQGETFNNTLSPTWFPPIVSIAFLSITCCFQSFLDLNDLVGCLLHYLRSR
ncbi:hypothetical protein HanRHA438_Chr02g0089061 [Helianthus annuus]|nr:hypothetical protein HanRHA438_Chr02g0089061 [Helianthus annuus]